MASRSMSFRTNLTGRNNNNNENKLRTGKEVVAKITQGPTLRRAVLGDIANKATLLQRSVSVDTNNAKQAPPTKTTAAFKKPLVNSKATKAKKTIRPPLPTCIKEADVTVVMEESMTSLSVSVAGQPENMSVVEEKPDTPKPKEAQVEEQPSPECADPEMLELSVAFSNKLLAVTDIDAEDKDNPQLVSEYVNHIYIYMRDLEKKNCVRRRYLDGREVTPRMRTILVDWLAQVHSRFNLMQETFYLTIAILDRFMQLVPDIPKDELQLVGVTSMFVAGKYEEMYCTEIGDFVYITDKAYNKQQIRRMEIKILKTLNYYISFPLPLHFLRRNSKAAQVDGTQHTLAKYLMELCMPDYHMCHYKASEIAAAALALTMKLIGPHPEWTDTLVYYSGYTEEELTPIVCKMAQCITRSHTAKQQYIPQKYRHSKHMKISEIPELQGSIIRNLSAKAVSCS